MTNINIDLGIIVTALAPTVAIIVAYTLAKRDAVSNAEKLDGIHTLVNDAMTREKRTRLEDLKAQKLVLERVLGDDITEDHLALLVSMEDRIAELEAEVDQRDKTAARAFPTKGGGG